MTIPTFPTIHHNGSGRTWLVESYAEAAAALDRAYEAVKQTAPNGRDYYPQGPAAMEAAIAEHMDRLRTIDRVKDELEALAIHCDTDTPSGAPRR